MSVTDSAVLRPLWTINERLTRNLQDGEKW